MSAPDERAVKTLMRTYWSSAGWREDPTTAPDELAHAIEAGVMFQDTPTVAHDEIVSGVLDAVARVSARDVADAFLGSLTSRRLDLRSALGSYVIARHLEPHSFEPGPSHVAPGCAICGLPEVERDIDWSVQNFERFKWGGVRRDNLDYAWLDLQQFSRADRPRPTPADRAALNRLLDELENAPPTTTAAQMAQKPLPSIKSNKAERAVLLDILGVCSVLETPAHRGYADAFVLARDRVIPPLRYVEQAYPSAGGRPRTG
jgi:hypothetical protein